MEDSEVLRLALNTAQSALSEQIVFRNYLLAAITALVGCIVFLFKAYQSSVNKQLEMGKAGFELAQSVTDVKEVTKQSISKLEEIGKINCNYVSHSIKS
jgi:hypothetical protein